MKLLTIVGARPQFIKAAPVSRELRKYFSEILLHTGQHYDTNLSQIFFEELNIPEPDYNLGIGSASHGEQTGKMLIKIEEILFNEQPEYVIVYGDTNSTLAGALAASKLHIPLIHIEAGLRSYNKYMPEEQNRVLTDHISDILFCPTNTAVKNLEKEGITKNVYNVGDVMYDSVLFNVTLAEKKSSILGELNLLKKDYYLATVHRAENTDSRHKLDTILTAFNESDKKVVFPIHPRTSNKLKDCDKSFYKNILFIEPVSYLDMLKLVNNSKKVLTDSGGLQKEAYFLNIPCVTLREETEWVETLDGKWNKLAEIDKDKIIDAIIKDDITATVKDNQYFGKGNAAQLITEIIKR